MPDIRDLAERHLAITLEGPYSKEVILTDPDGIKQTLRAQVLYDKTVQNPMTGQDQVINEPVVVLRRSSMTRVPVSSEKWFVKMPVSPVAGATKEDFVLGGGRAVEGGASIGFIRLYPKKAKQK